MNRINFQLLLLLMFLISTTHLFATSISWTGATNSDWSNASNWSPAQVPGPLDDVIINVSTNNPVLIGTDTIKSLTIDINVDAALTLATPSKLYIQESTQYGIHILAGQIVNNGSIYIDSTDNVGLKITSGASLLISISGSIFVDRFSVAGVHNLGSLDMQGVLKIGNQSEDLSANGLINDGAFFAENGALIEFNNIGDSHFAFSWFGNLKVELSY